MINEDYNNTYNVKWQYVNHIADNGNCLGWREGPNKPYVWQTYNETLLRAKNFGSGLVCQGLIPGQSTFVGKFLTNFREQTTQKDFPYIKTICISRYIFTELPRMGNDRTSCLLLFNGHRSAVRYSWCKCMCLYCKSKYVFIAFTISIIKQAAINKLQNKRIKIDFYSLTLQ